MSLVFSRFALPFSGFCICCISGVPSGATKVSSLSVLRIRFDLGCDMEPSDDAGRGRLLLLRTDAVAGVLFIEGENMMLVVDCML